MQESIQEQLKVYLLQTVPGAKSASGGKEILCRCHMCMDSPDPSKRHLYIGLGDDNTPPMYNCFLCNSSGIVDGRFLRSMNIYDSELISNVNDGVRKIINKPGNQIYKDSKKIFNIKNTFITDNELTQKKLQYINRRLGRELSYSDALALKIVLNLGDLIGSNNITNLSRHPNIVQQLNERFIGFLSVDNAFVAMRNLTPGKVHKTIDSRYVNYNVFGKVDNSQRYYVIPTGPIDISSPYPIKIYIAEGAFDILSLHMNVIQDHNHSIFTAICGKAYLNAIKYFIQDIGIVNAEFHLCPDNDIPDYTMNNIVRYLEPFGMRFFVHRNSFQGEKDFGVPSDRINHSNKIIYGG